MHDLISDKYFELNKMDVNAEVIDGEAIIINVTTGVYYSLEDIGVYVWELLSVGNSLAETIQAVIERYPVPAEQASVDLEDFVSELIAEGLILETNQYGSSSSTEVTTRDSVEHYKKPFLNIYRDMGDLLALDPPTPGLSLTPWEDGFDVDASKKK